MAILQTTGVSKMLESKTKDSIVLSLVTIFVIIIMFIAIKEDMIMKERMEAFALYAKTSSLYQESLQELLSVPRENRECSDMYAKRILATKGINKVSQLRDLLDEKFNVNYTNFNDACTESISYSIDLRNAALLINDGIEK